MGSAYNWVLAPLSHEAFLSEIGGPKKYYGGQPRPSGGPSAAFSMPQQCRVNQYAWIFLGVEPWNGQGGTVAGPASGLVK